MEVEQMRLVAQPFSLGPPNPVVTCSSAFLYVRVSQNQYHWHLRLDNSLLQAATLPIVDCLAGSLGSTHYMPASNTLFLPRLWQPKLSPDIDKWSLGNNTTSSLRTPLPFPYLSSLCYLHPTSPLCTLTPTLAIAIDQRPRSSDNFIYLA